MHGQIPLKKGDSCSKIAKVSILVLLCAVARDIKEKERIRFTVNLLTRCKQTLQYNLAQLKSKEKQSQEKLSKTKKVIISLFSLFLFFLFAFLALLEILASISL